MDSEIRITKEFLDKVVDANARILVGQVMKRFEILSSDLDIKKAIKELFRVLKPKAHAIHLFLADAGTGNPLHDVLVSPPWNYLLTGSEEDGKMKQKYFKTV